MDIVTLIPTDGYGQRVEAHYLQAHSAVWRKRISDSQSPTTTRGSHFMLNVDMKDSDLRIIIACMRSFKDGRPQINTVDQIRRLWDACELYELDLVENSLLLLLTRSVELYPWAVFCSAARLDDLGSAKLALENMHHDKRIGLDPYTHMDSEMAEDCPQKYLVGFFTALRKHRNLKWENVARAFKLPEDPKPDEIINNLKRGYEHEADGDVQFVKAPLRRSTRQRK